MLRDYTVSENVKTTPFNLQVSVMKPILYGFFQEFYHTKQKIKTPKFQYRLVYTICHQFNVDNNGSMPWRNNEKCQPCFDLLNLKQILLTADDVLSYNL
jgi:hypothetical protein